MSKKRAQLADGQEALLAGVPSVHRLLDTPCLRAAGESTPRAVLLNAARLVLSELRRQIQGDSRLAAIPDDDVLAHAIAAEAERATQPSLRGAINGTGIVLHTGLGRARLAASALDSIAKVAAGHATVEIDPETGKRGSRRDHVRGLLCELTGAEDAAVVNNCAGAVFLAVSALAAGREVIISRGELVEIGGAFRMPDIIRASGAYLVEVGTTNRTRLSDYEAAITDRTGLILRCHPSNFAIVGFTEITPTRALVDLGRKHGIPIMDDQGSGAILPPGQIGLPADKGSLPESVACGCDLVTASGDKLMGGPQAGILLGSKALVETIVSHPLSRALRVDKLTLVALESTLRLYRDPERAVREIPTLRYIARSPAELTGMAEMLKVALERAAGNAMRIETVPGSSQVGGGSLPGENLPTTCVRITGVRSGQSAEQISAHFRSSMPPIFGRIQADAFLLDPRTLEPEEIELIARAAGTLS